MTEQTTSKPKRRYAREKSTVSKSAAPAPVAETTPAAPATETTAAPRETKIGNVVALLERQEGATLDELIAATGWLPHTTRAALTGLRKKGHTLDKSKRGETTCYRIVASAVA